MTEENWTVKEVLEIFQIEERFLIDLEEEEIICPACTTDPRRKVFSRRELEKLRLAKILHEDMGVNLPGVEIIIRMRKDMDEMKRQFDSILEDLVRDVRERVLGEPF